MVNIYNRRGAKNPAVRRPIIRFDKKTPTPILIKSFGGAVKTARFHIKNTKDAYIIVIFTLWKSNKSLS